jgi:preprotein translocase SecE subunit
VIKIINKIKSSFFAITSEAKKISWPTKQETTQSVIVVVIFLLVFAFLLLLMDKSIEYVLYKLILGWKS